ncbi:hypothetical protein Cpir12675_002244 [Ceratocystis pirilliformis]|uniref:GH16 domain-containing protein n=1 Tax=Ceratocystis pirilliformis TaxID=259994 RepID=A0ABR3ZAR0_9PEZI
MLLSLLAYIAFAAAWSAPKYTGYSLVWAETFSEDYGAMPSSRHWNIITNISVNNESQRYTTSNENLQLSGKGTLRIVPQLANRKWTSGRIESKYSFSPTDGKKTIAEAFIRFGNNNSGFKKGIWPAFWTLGQTCRTNSTWPSCGEIDILETVNGELTGYGTVHCGETPGGPCKEPSGIQKSTQLPSQSWYRWRVTIDRTTGSWRTESIKWYRDNFLFHTITGAEVGNEIAWESLAHDARYFILNVAVGGTWPGATNQTTLGGLGAMMEVGYVAQYESKLA